MKCINTKVLMKKKCKYAICTSDPPKYQSRKSSIMDAHAIRRFKIQTHSLQKNENQTHCHSCECRQ